MVERRVQGDSLSMDNAVTLLLEVVKRLDQKAVDSLTAI
jgi:hypothetical protein